MTSAVTHQGKNRRGQLFARYRIRDFPGIFFTTGQFDLWQKRLPRANKKRANTRRCEPLEVEKSLSPGRFVLHVLPKPKLEQLLLFSIWEDNYPVSSEHNERRVFYELPGDCFIAP